MSLSVDGVWKAGVWATTVWADGVWREGGAVLADTPANFGIAAPPSMPGGLGVEFEMSPRDPKVDSDFFALSRIAMAADYLENVEQWLAENVKDGEEFVDVFDESGILEVEDDFLPPTPRRRR